MHPQASPMAPRFSFAAHPAYSTLPLRIDNPLAAPSKRASSSQASADG
jgi:hypothetical protein